ncbi:hypothetical protein BVC80_9021g41 [Macleaya cordata]|uniref:RNase H type-1 domain-containing protein n=1 Tax=Macleaya cordata TaxID=56857 RepID=A0A200QV18_MACCD|nr:hypothetical protein BVC80_9021g41 [Macleaya cordata]
MNYDASFINTKTNVGLGFLYRDHTGRFSGSIVVGDRASSTKELEGLALLRAMQWAICLNLHRVIFEGDCASITRCANKAADALAKKG